MFVLCQSILLGPSKRLEPEKVAEMQCLEDGRMRRPCFEVDVHRTDRVGLETVR